MDEIGLVTEEDPGPDSAFDALVIITDTVAGFVVVSRWLGATLWRRLLYHFPKHMSWA